VLRGSLILVIALMLVAEPASAQTPEAQATVTSMMGELDAAIAALDINDCNAACEAIASMKRAAERICDLEPGPRCDTARAKVEEARKKVRAACPTCEAATGKATTVTAEDKPKPRSPKKQEQKDNQPAPDVEDEHQREYETRPSEPSAPPPSAAPSDGGCAPCAVGSREPQSHASWLLLLGAAIAWRRRRCGMDGDSC
jgi:MYXO-CTERM domain-containing protein